MLITSLVSIQASTVYTADTVPIQKTYGVYPVPVEAAGSSSSSAAGESSPSSMAGSSATWSP